MRGRYVCHAKTDAAKYTVTFDLPCTDLTQAKCVQLYSIALDGSGVLYRRP